jgi:DNA-binding winged helix-turn-helix (wHTH) protein
MIKFNRFKLNPETRELFADEELVKIQNKSFDLLLYLIEHKDRAVSKDELLDKLWDGRVVSESVLSHASTKLRAALNDSNGKGDIIRTVYGYGLQFIANIENSLEAKKAELQSSLETPTTAKIETTNNKFRIALALLSLSVLIFLSWVANKSFWLNQESSELIVKNTDKPKINFVTPLTLSSKDDWLNKGLALYLNQISAYSDNALLLPEELNNIESINKHYSINNVIETTQDKASLELVYNNSQQNQSTLSVSLDNLPKAIGLINEWTCKTVFTQNEACESKFASLTINNAYVLESYFRGKAAILSSEPKKAINFFEVCLEQEPDFILARLALAQAHLELSDYPKALSQAQTTIQATNNILIQHQAYIIIGNAYLRQSNFESAKTALNQVIESDQAQFSQKAIALLDMAQVTMDSDELELAYNLAKSSSELLKKLDIPLLVARAEEVMGTIKMTIGELVIAQNHLENSLKIFEQLEYESGIEKVLSPLGLVMQSQGLLNASLIYGQQRQKITEKMGDPISIAGSHLHLANLLLEMGELDKAMQHADEMWKIVIHQDEPQALLLAYFIAGEIAKSSEKYSLALEKYQLAYDIANEYNIPFRQVQISCSLGATAIDAQILDLAEDYLNQCSEFAEKQDDKLFQVVVKLYQSQLFKQKGQLTKSKSLLNHALELAQPMGNDHLFYEIYLELYNHSIESDVAQAESYLLSIPDGYKDDYVYTLYLAQIALKKNQYTQALQLALEAQQMAKDNWSEDDQLLLNEIQNKIK